MRALSDKWNPRLWLREWLNAPSRNEREQSERIKAGMRETTRLWHAERTTKKGSGQSLVETLRSAIESEVRSSLATGRTSAHPTEFGHAPVVPDRLEEAPGSPR